LRRQLRSAVHDVLSGRSIGRRAKANADKPDLSLAVRFDIMNSIASNRHAPSKSDTCTRNPWPDVSRYCTMRGTGGVRTDNCLPGTSISVIIFYFKRFSRRNSRKCGACVRAVERLFSYSRVDGGAGNGGKWSRNGKRTRDVVFRASLTRRVSEMAKTVPPSTEYGECPSTLFRRRTRYSRRRVIVPYGLVSLRHGTLGRTRWIVRID